MGDSLILEEEKWKAKLKKPARLRASRKFKSGTSWVYPPERNKVGNPEAENRFLGLKRWLSENINELPKDNISA